MFSLSKPHFSLICCGTRELRERIQTVQTTQKITEAMKLVVAVRVRHAQEATVSGRPFSSNLAANAQRHHSASKMMPYPPLSPMPNP
ncbi:hypothetical protein AAZX31_20G214900 [Glycine max]|uniref:ATP synthase gamma chain 1, chloroplastic n=1 Tax=Glycine soja TaxID=3848 RepID=A0A445F945_GLYSO|nr:hypothetical protein JHK86_057035 [Glycine max]KAG5075867.1 hypothetical protein JHK84_057098 [Glycine max]KAG5078517.1 hypothetical protein JHK82_057212 [Glycine max]RZB45336.1 ATP synthase gamma chain 1, chloroplastic [Glycine soja]